MIKRIYGCLFLFSVFVLAWICIIWEQANGQLLAHFTSSVDAQLVGSVEEILNGDAEYALFSMREQSMNGGKVLTYECAAYHPDALGIRMISGSPLTPRHIEQGDRVVMLSKAAAQEISPGLDCIGRTIQINGEDYRIIGIYETCSPLISLTAISEESVVLPIQQGGAHRELFLWVNAQDSSREVHQRLQERIGALHFSDAFASLMVQDISSKSQIWQQGILVLGWFELLLICCRLLKSRRNAHLREPQAYRSRAILRLLTPGLMLAACLFAGMYLAKNLVLDESIFPARFLDLGEWLKLFRSNILAANSAPRLPVFASLRNDWLERLALGFGGISIVCLLLYISGRRNSK